MAFYLLVMKIPAWRRTAFLEYCKSNAVKTFIALLSVKRILTGTFISGYVLLKLKIYWDVLKSI